MFQIVRANRRGTGPVDYEALSAATNSDEADSNDNKFANVTVRKRSDDKTFVTPSKTVGLFCLLKFLLINSGQIGSASASDLTAGSFIRQYVKISFSP